MATGDLAQRVRAWAQTPAVQAARLRGGDLDALGVGAVLDLVSLELAACLAADDAALRPEEALRQARVSAELRLPLEDESEPDEDAQAPVARLLVKCTWPHRRNAFDELVVHRDGRVCLRGDDSVLVPWRRVAALPPL